MSLRRYTLPACLLFLLSAAPAHAEWILTPHFGTTFGADTSGRPHAVMGAALTQFDEDAFGWELDVAFVPDFFAGRYGTQDFTGSDSSVLSAMGNAIIGVPVAGQHRDRIRPYVSLGAGLIQMHVASPDGGGFFKTRTLEAAWNAGVGGIGFLTSRIGLRGDIRYIRSFQDQQPSWTRGLDVDVAPGNFDYFRGTVGLTVRLGRID